VREFDFQNSKPTFWRKKMGVFFRLFLFNNLQKKNLQDDNKSIAKAEKKVSASPELATEKANNKFRGGCSVNFKKFCGI
jgi:hypothetical protein